VSHHSTPAPSASATNTPSSTARQIISNKVDHRNFERQVYQAAQQHFTAAMNGRTKLPIKDWQKEQNELAAKRYTYAMNITR